MINMKKYLAILAFLIFYASGSYAQSQDIKLTFVGDIMLDGLPGKYIKAGKDPFLSFASLFKQSDKTIGNLECVVGTTGKAEIKPFVLRQTQEYCP
jgi:hypothetical protein